MGTTQLAENKHSAIYGDWESDLLAIDIRSAGMVVRRRHHCSVTVANAGEWYEAVDLGNGRVARVASAVSDVVG